MLARLPVARTIVFFEEIGVRLKEEPRGKLFPVTDRSRDVLDALLTEAQASGVALRPSTRVLDVVPEGGLFVLQTSRGPLTARRVVLATGGLSLPKTGSDGAGLAIAKRLGHQIVPTTPALVPLVLEDDAPHAALSGVAHDVELMLQDGRGAVLSRIAGPMLWTHFGVSGPAALDVSRHLLRGRVERTTTNLAINFLPGATFESLERRWIDAAAGRPRASVSSLLGETLPASVVSALLHHLSKDPSRRLSELTRDDRRSLIHALTRWPLRVRDSRGYNYAEATAGGVSLDEIDPATMESRVCRGLHLVGEMLDVDGRLGGFNFQWAWSSARAAAEGLARVTA